MPQASKLILPIFFLLIFIFFTHPFEGSGDFYHHVNTGRWIIEHHSLPYLDEFTHTAYGLPWVAHSWLSGLVFYLVLKFFGEIGITLLVSSLALSTFILLYFLLKSYNIPKQVILFTLALAAIPTSIRYPQRPEVFTYPLAISLLLIDQLRKVRPWRHKLLPLLYPIIILLWANLYGAAVIAGLGILIILGLKQLLEDHFKILNSQLLFYLSCLVSFPISLLNGYGLKSVLYLYFYIPKVTLYEGEWASVFTILKYAPISYLVTYQYYILIYLLYLGIFLLLVIFSLKHLLRSKFFLFLGLAIFIPLFALRHTPLAVILSTPLLITALIYQLRVRRFILAGFIIFIASLMFILSLWVNPPGLSNKQNPGLIGMINFIQSHQLSGKAFNYTHLGGLLTYKLYPNVSVFIDTRDEVFLETSALKDLYGSFLTGKSIIPLLNKYQIDLVVADFVTDGLSYRDLFYSPDWAIVYYSDRYFVAVPKKVAQQKNLLEIDFVDPFSQTGAKPGLEKEAIKYYQSQASQTADPLISNIFLASANLNLGNVDQAINILSKLNLSLGPIAILNDKERSYLLSESYFQKNSCIKGKQFLDKAIWEAKLILIFPNQRRIPSKINKGLALYWLKCQKNSSQAKYYLDLYLAQPELTPLERLKTTNEFKNTEGQ